MAKKQVKPQASTPKKDAKKTSQSESRKPTSKKSASTDSVASKSVVAQKLSSIKISPQLARYTMWVAVLVFSFIMIDLFVQYLNNDYSVAIVNGKRISRSEFATRLEETHGSTMAQNLISEELIRQEAATKKVTVSDEEVEKVVQQTIDDLGGQEQYEQALTANNLTDAKFRRDLELRLTAQKLLVEEPAEEELKEFFDQFKSVYFSEDDKFEDNKDKVKEIYFNQKFNEKYGAWIEDLQTKANIQDNVSNKPKYGLLKVTTDIVENLWEKLNSK